MVCGVASASRRAPRPQSAAARAQALEPRAKLRYMRAVKACPRTRDRAIAPLPLYAGT